MYIVLVYQVRRGTDGRGARCRCSGQLVDPTGQEAKRGGHMSFLRRRTCTVLLPMLVMFCARRIGPLVGSHNLICVCSQCGDVDTLETTDPDPAAPLDA